MASYDRFVFKVDDDFPNMLHIWVRHTKTVEDAVEIWFEGTNDQWDPKYKRFATYKDTRGVYWIWLIENKW